MPAEQKKTIARYSIPVLLFLFTAVLIRDTYGHKWDNDLFRAWAIHDLQAGLSKAYYSDTNYLPLYHYILYGYAWLLGSVETIMSWYPCIHLVTFLFDILGIWFIYKWINKQYDFNTLLLLLVLNVGYTYNTLLWGQVDGILSTLLFGSIYFAWKKRMIWGAVLFVLAVNMKLQGIVLLPVFGLLYLFNIAENKNLKAIMGPVAAAVVTQFVILLPFIIEWDGLPRLWNVVHGSVGMWPFISMHAYNLWYLVYGDPRFMEDSTVFVAGLTHNQFGFILFLTTSLFALLPLMLTVWKKFTRGTPEVINRTQVWLVAAIVNLLFFYFNTQMHERYCHPALIFVAAYAFYKRDFFPFVLFSITYFLSLDRIVQWLRLNVKNSELFIYSPVLLSILYLVILCYLIVRLVADVRKEKDLEKEREVKFG